MIRFCAWAMAIGLSLFFVKADAQTLRYQTLSAVVSIPHPDSAITGDVRYGVSPTRPSQRELRFLARETWIRSVRFNDMDVTFTHEHDTLVVQLTSPMRLASRSHVQLEYVARPTFGAHRWPKNVLWTSLQPGAQSHWIPVPLENDVMVTTDFQFLIPESQKSIAPGQPVETLALYTHWKQDQPIALSSLMMAVGDLDLRTTEAKTYQLILPDDRWETPDAVSAVDVRFANRPEPVQEADSDRLRLALDMIIEEDTQIVIGVRLLSGRARGSITLPLRQYIGGTIIPSPLTVASAGDEIRMSIASRIDNLTVSDEFSEIDVVESKPGRFWLYQLRTSTDPEKRRLAAEALGSVTDAPDVGLALSSLFRNEADPGVKAALLRSYAAQSAGRIGSHPLILNALREKGELRLVAMHELGRYTQSEPVIEAVSQTIRTSDDIPMVNAALKTYQRLVTQDISDDLMRRLLNEDSQADFALTILTSFQGRPEAAIIAPRARFYLNENFSWNVRKSVLSILTATEKDSSSIRDVFTRHAADPDPRFRNALLDAVHLLTPEDREAFVRDRLQTEYDPRLLARIRSMD